MRKVEEVKIIKIKEDVRIGDIILEAGDKIQILSEATTQFMMKIVSDNRGDLYLPKLAEKTVDLYTTSFRTNFPAKLMDETGHLDISTKDVKMIEVFYKYFIQYGGVDKNFSWTRYPDDNYLPFSSYTGKEKPNKTKSYKAPYM